MAHVLIAYGTRQGHTKVITDRVAAGLRAAGHDVDETDLRKDARYTDTSRDYDFTDYDDVTAFANEFAASLSTSSHA